MSSEFTKGERSETHPFSRVQILGCVFTLDVQLCHKTPILSRNRDLYPNPHFLHWRTKKKIKGAILGGIQYPPTFFGFCKVGMGLTLLGLEVQNEYIETERSEL